ncbi:Protein NRT1/ PTR FAMILY 2.8 [Linum perenne]
MGLIGNLTLYLQSKYNMDSILVVNVFNVWSGSSNLTPLIGAFLSDAYLGRFRTLLYGSIASFLVKLLTLLTPPSCPEGSNCEEANGGQLAVLYIGLALLAIGAGGIRPCNIAFGADQFDTRTEKGRAQLESFFNWWYFSFTVALVIALTIVVYIQTNVSWFIGYSVPTACLFFSICLFLVGKHTYIIKKAQGSMSVNPWRLCSIQQVEQLKLLVGIVPVWFTGIGCFIAMDQMNTLGVMQAIQCDNKVGNFKIPPAWMGLGSMICLSIWIFIYEQVYLPIAKRNTNKDKRMTMRQRINTGIVMSFLCMIVASSVEKKRRSLALEHKSYISPLSIFALLPQFALSGLTEAFAAIAVMEFLTTHLPESMRTIAGAVFFLSLSVSSYLNAALVNLVHRITAGYGHRPWLGGRDLNQSRIDNFFTLIAALAVVNLLYFNFFSCRYLKPSAQKSSESVDVEDGLGKKQEEQA